MIAIIALVLCGYAAGIACWILAERAVPYRVDVPPGGSAFQGRSRIYQVNVLRRANYRSEGHHLHRWLVATYVASGVAFMGAALLFVVLYVWH